MDKVIGFLKTSGHAIASSVSGASLVDLPLFQLHKRLFIIFLTMI